MLNIFWYITTITFIRNAFVIKYKVEFNPVCPNLNLARTTSSFLHFPLNVLTVIDFCML